MADWFFDVLLDIVLFLPRLAWSFIADFIVFMMGLVTFPDLTLANVFSGVGGDILYFLTLLQVHNGLSLVLGALGARFILRRIPVIG